MTREEAIRHIKDIICENNTVKHSDIVVFEEEKEALKMAIEALEQPSRRNGKWVPNKHWCYPECSICGKTYTENTVKELLNSDKPHNFCPNCGAKMING